MNFVHGKKKFLLRRKDTLDSKLKKISIESKKKSFSIRKIIPRITVSNKLIEKLVNIIQYSSVQFSNVSDSGWNLGKKVNIMKIVYHTL